jgi:hypothetical protein
LYRGETVKRIAFILCLTVAVASAGEDPRKSAMLSGAQFSQSHSFHLSATARDVVSISSDGRIFWNGREVKTDADFRAAMLTAMKTLNTKCAP